MGRFSNVLLASDFDHTLTDMSGQIPARNLEAIAAFQAEGGIFTVASGRSIPMFRKKAALVPVNAPCILYNGGACYDYRTDELLFAFPLADDAPQLLQALRDHCPNERTEVQTLDCHYAYGDDPRRDAALAANGVPVQHEAVLPPQPWIKLAVYGTSKQVGYDDPANTPPEEIAYFDELQRYTAGLVGDRYAITRALPRNMEISAGGCDKGTAAAVWPTRSAAAFSSASATHRTTSPCCRPQITASAQATATRACAAMTSAMPRRAPRAA